MKRLHVFLAVLALAVPASEGVAKNKGKEKDKDKGKAVKVEKRVVFVDADRQVARNWWRQTYGRDCPPGLAKKNNGCLPPGQARKRYVVGQRLPTTVVIGSVPAGLRLSAAPVGYRYAYVDGDILLIDAASRLVADVIVNALD
jgi:Ni/Co efflux regulator RcnB